MCIFVAGAAGATATQLVPLLVAPAVRTQISKGPDNNRVRREGTRNLLAAARAAGAGRFLAQSVAFELSGDDGAAVVEHEGPVLDAGGVVLRYGHFHGPGTYHPDEPAPPPPCTWPRRPAGRSRPSTLRAA